MFKGALSLSQRSSVLPFTRLIYRIGSVSICLTQLQNWRSGKHHETRCRVLRLCEQFERQSLLFPTMPSMLPYCGSVLREVGLNRIRQAGRYSQIPSIKREGYLGESG